jgi:hypothetical protein
MYFIYCVLGCPWFCIIYSIYAILAGVRVSSSCFTSCKRRVNLVTNSVINHEWGKDREMFTTSGTAVVICDIDIP